MKEVITMSPRCDEHDCSAVLCAEKPHTGEVNRTYYECGLPLVGTVVSTNGLTRTIAGCAVCDSEGD
jgi:hypothetical protein